MNRLNDLFHRYISNTASREEIAEFMTLIQDEANRAELEKNIEERYQLDHAGLLPEERAEVVQNIIAVDNSSRKSTAQKLWIAAAAVATLAVASIFIYPKLSKDKSETIAETGVTFSGKDYIHLPDGSTVTMKEGSKLTYSPSFGKDNRDVVLSGEAFFDVVSNPEKPFRVYTGKIVTTVLGTAFNIHAFPNEEQVKVTVQRGKVAVGDDTRVYEQILPDQQLTVNTTTLAFEKTEVKAVEESAWKEDYFILDRVTMEEAAVLIGKRFNVEVKVSDELKKCVISAWFLHGEDLNHVVEAVSIVRQATYSTTNNVVTIEGGVGCAETK
jgi:ferric-dicitrate binding protein FerR (iron transport regulator)